MNKENLDNLQQCLRSIRHWDHSLRHHSLRHHSLHRRDHNRNFLYYFQHH